MKLLEQEQINALNVAAESLSESTWLLRMYDPDIHTMSDYEHHFNNYRKQLGILCQINASIGANGLFNSKGDKTE